MLTAFLQNIQFAAFIAPRQGPAFLYFAASSLELEVEIKRWAQKP